MFLEDHCAPIGKITRRRRTYIGELLHSNHSPDLSAGALLERDIYRTYSLQCLESHRLLKRTNIEMLGRSKYFEHLNF